MFKNLRNNYYFGKAGKADYTVDDLPTTRWQLFMVTLRTRLATLMKVNVLYALVFIPALVVLVLYLGNVWNALLAVDQGDGTSMLRDQIIHQMAEAGKTETLEAGAAVLSPEQASQEVDRNIFWMLMWLAPCIAITGPFTAGVSYLCRNWARDEHAFAWQDFKDALIDNWKQALPVSAITGLMPVCVYTAYKFYEEQALTSWFMFIPQALVVIVGALWAIGVTYMYPLMVGYELKFKDLLRNAFVLAVGRLPFSVGVRLLHCVPVALAFLVVTLFPNVMPYAVMILFVWYLMIGLMMSRFTTSSYCNAVFDRFVNPRIQGAKVNQGLYHEEDDGDAPDGGSADGKNDEDRKDPAVAEKTSGTEA